MSAICPIHIGMVPTLDYYVQEYYQIEHPISETELLVVRQENHGSLINKLKVSHLDEQLYNATCDDAAKAGCCNPDLFSRRMWQRRLAM